MAFCESNNNGFRGSLSGVSRFFIKTFLKNRFFFRTVNNNNAPFVCYMWRDGESCWPQGTMNDNNNEMLVASRLTKTTDFKGFSTFQDNLFLN